MSTLRRHALFSFPDPVNEYAARTVAAGVVLMCALVLLGQTWVLVPLCYGFWARVLTGPTLSPLGRLAASVVAPRLSAAPRPVPGPPKRFAQGMGTVFSTTAVVLWFGFGLGPATAVVTGLLTVAALLESAVGICLGCIVFARLMRAGLIPESVCEACADLSRRRPVTAGSGPV